MMTWRVGVVLLAWAMVAACESESGDADALDAGASDGDEHDPTAPTGCDLSPQVGHGRLMPKDEDLPQATGTCPGFVVGDGCEEDSTSLICEFHPEGTAEPREVRIWMSDAAHDVDSAVVVFWHGLGGAAANAAASLAGLGANVVADILEKGGIVVAPEKRSDRSASSFTNLPWLLAQGPGDEDDLWVMDEVIACAHEKIGVDFRRIHSTGMSAGGLHTGQVGPRRSGYLASIAVFSGGRIGRPPVQDPDHKYPAILFHGGPGDQVVIQFDDASRSLHNGYREAGHFAMICDHGADHTVPESAAQAAWRFLQDHPYGDVPTPYCDGIPEDIFDDCEH